MAISQLHKQDDQDVTAMELPVNLIKVDPSYQRSLQPTRVKKMAAEWDARKAGSIGVSRRKDNSYYAFDGQHRLEAARAAGQSHILCHVIEAGAQDEAGLFEAVNATQQKANPVVRFRAAVASGNPVALEIVRIVEACGFVLTLDEKRRDAVPDRIVAINTLLRLYHSGRGKAVHADPDRLIGILTLIRQTWPGQANNVSEFMLSAVDMFIRHASATTGFKPERFVQQLAGITPDALIHGGAEFARATGTGVAAGIVNVMIKHYDRSRRLRIPPLLIKGKATDEGV